MTDQKVSGGDYLTSLSPKDQAFDIHKANSKRLARLYGLDGNQGLRGFLSGDRVIEFASYSGRINECGNWLKFWQTTDSFKLIDARFCKVPFCPMCQFRRSLKWRAKFLSALPEIQAKYPTHKWVFLTLTVRNCDMGSLRATIQEMGKAWTRLSQLAAFPFEGCIKSLEVTRAWDWYDQSGKFLGRHGIKWFYQQKDPDKKFWRVEPTDEVHPHYHILGLVPASYFTGRGYIKQEEWARMWQRSLRVEYTPIVHIQRVKNKSKNVIPTLEALDNQSTDLSDSAMIKGLCETLKYTVKEQDLLGQCCTDENINSDWLKELTSQLYLLRRVEYKGCLKEFGKEVEKSLEDLIEINDEKEDDDSQDGNEIVARWNNHLKRYLVTITDSL